MLAAGYSSQLSLSQGHAIPQGHATLWSQAIRSDDAVKVKARSSDWRQFSSKAPPTVRWGLHYKHPSSLSASAPTAPSPPPPPPVGCSQSPWRSLLSTTDCFLQTQTDPHSSLHSFLMGCFIVLAISLRVFLALPCFEKLFWNVLFNISIYL